MMTDPLRPIASSTKTPNNALKINTDTRGWIKKSTTLPQLNIGLDMKLHGLINNDLSMPMCVPARGRHDKADFVIHGNKA